MGDWDADRDEYGYPALDDAKVALGSVAQHGQSFLISWVVVRCHGLLYGIERDKYGALLEARLALGKLESATCMMV